MEISGLLGKLKSSEKDKKPKSFLALELTDEVVVAAVWHVESSQTEIVSVGMPVEWGNGKNPTEELVKAADATISDAMEGISDDINEVIFGVTPSWANPQGILGDKLSLIKSICKELEFKPLGFVVITDSLLRYLKMQEGIPASSILVQLTSTTITVTLVKLGKIIGTESVERTDDIASDVEEGIARFNESGDLPARILVFNGMHSVDEEVQNLIAYDWQSKFNFLHIPKIESLPKDIVIRSVAVAGGMEVAKSLGIEVVDPEPSESLPKEEEVKEAVVEDEIVSAEEIGFTPHKKLPVDVMSKASRISLDEIEDHDVEVAPKRKIKPVKLPKFSLPEFTMPKLKLGKLPIILGLIAVILLVGFGVVVWMVPKAVVTVYIEPKTLEEPVELTLASGATEVNLDNATIPGVDVNITESGQDSVATSGHKTIGDPATGTVTIYNRTSLTKTFDKGTVITAKSLKFTLDESVTVASKSAGADYVDVPGKAAAEVTAEAIGENGNLAEGTEFSVGEFSQTSYIAKNDNAFAGGSSEEVQVVSKDDKSTLAENLLDKLVAQGQVELESDLPVGTGVIVLSKSSQVEEESYSSAVGEQATTLTGTMTVSVHGLKYSQTDVEQLLSSTIDAAIPSGYIRTSDPPLLTLGEVKSESKDSVSISAKAALKLIPEIETTSIKNTLRGLSGNDVPAALSSTVGLVNASVEISPSWLPPRIKRMPKNPENIVVKIVATESN